MQDVAAFLPHSPCCETYPPHSTRAEPWDPSAEILHQFRPPQREVPTVVPLAFSLLIVVLLVGLFAAMRRMGLNLRRFPTSGVG